MELSKEKKLAIIEDEIQGQREQEYRLIIRCRVFKSLKDEASAKKVEDALCKITEAIDVLTKEKDAAIKK